MKRAKHTLSHYRMNTCDMGELMPIGCVPVLPGDTIQHHTSALVRVSPLNTPVMHPVKVRLHHFFVPNRLSWPESEAGGWENFITGGKDGNNTAQPPTLSLASNEKKSVLSGLGLPAFADGPPRGVNAMPLRAFNLIYNEYYRDQDLVEDRDLDDNTIPKIAWEKDYFSTARPWTQKGPDVTIPIGDSAPVATASGQGDLVSVADANSPGNQFAFQNDVASFDQFGTSISGDPSLFADLSQAVGVNVNDFRASFAIQRYQEARARYGSRFTEYLRYLGITPSDARLQRPEFLGGGTTGLNFSEVLQTSPGAEGEPGVGDLYGHGIAGTRTGKYRKFFEEHGYIITLMSVRPKVIYTQGAHREWLKKTKEDYFQRELASLGQQEILDYELYIRGGGDVFGYQDRYHEYRGHPSQISGDFLDVLDSWHLGRSFSGAPVLNQSFVDCTPSKRVFQVATNDTLWVMANHHMVARRMVPKRANPRIV